MVFVEALTPFSRLILFAITLHPGFFGADFDWGIR
jgi:hypothetical protein